MKILSKLGLIGLFFLLLSCEKNAEVDTLNIGGITEIKQDETVENTQYGLSLQVNKIDDNRCPEDVVCVWGGNATVEFQLTTKKGKYDFSLDTDESSLDLRNYTVIDNFKYQLLDVQPYPVSHKEEVVKTVKIMVSRQ